MLIIGGLVALGIVALLLAIFLMRDPKSVKREQPISVAETSGVPANVPPAETIEERPARAIQGPQETEVVPGAQAEVTTHEETMERENTYPTHLEEQEPLLANGNLPQLAEEQEPLLTNGNLSQLAEELQALNQQSREIEQRLQRIQHMVERIEQRGQLGQGEPTLVGVPAIPPPQSKQ